MTVTAEPHRQPFRPRARLMLLLGDQLIRDPGIALVELVKNAYDADATRCRVTLEGTDRDDPEARIVIEDDGEGMDRSTVLDVWLEPGTEHRRSQRREGERTERFGRLPLGEKGVGRFAVHKLGQRVRLVSRRRGRPEVVVEIDWREFEARRYLSDVDIAVRERKSELFTDGRTGTRIEISDLRDRPWDRRRVHAAYRAISSIRSPFSGPSTFDVELLLEPDPGWLRGLLRPDEVLDEAIYRCRATLEGDTLTYSYRFAPLGDLEGLDERRVEDTVVPMRLPVPDPNEGRKRTRTIDLSRHEIGPVEVELRIFERTPKLLRLTSSDPMGVRHYLDRNGGIRVYRDGVRVYDYGEPGNDWLELGARRIDLSRRRIATNQVVGAIHLELDSSADLVEKTNREGFIENDAYETFRLAILFLVSQVEAERSRDKDRIKSRYSTAKKKEPVVEELAELRAEIERRGLASSIGPRLDRIEKQYRESLERLLVAAGTGLNLSAALHEMDRGIRDLVTMIDRRDDPDRALSLATGLAETVEGLTWLTRQTGRVDVSARTLVRQAIANSEPRLTGRGIEIVDGTGAGARDFEVRCSRHLVTACLMNLIDNALYWLETKGGEDQRIYLGALLSPGNLPTLVVADTGPGFVDPPEVVTQPFFTRKPEGMGLGLHIVDEVMKAHRGRVLFPEPGELGVPEGFDGARVGLEFPPRD